MPGAAIGGVGDVEAWDYDTLEAMEGVERPLEKTGMAVAEAMGLLEGGGVSTAALRALLAKIEDQYDNSLAYHNAFHASDVVVATAYLAANAGLVECEPEEKLALLLAAAGHDVGHGGRNNAFLQATNHPLAQKCASSPLEHYHASVLKSAMEETGLLGQCAGLSPEARERTESLVEQLVLATNMAQHRAYLEKLTAEGLDKASQRLSKLIAIIKLADLSNVIRPLKTANEWAARILRECDAQAAEEEEIARRERGTEGLGPDGKSLTPKSRSLAEHQLGFLDNVVRPFVDTLSELAGNDSRSLLELKRHADINRDAWAAAAVR